jgi:hypothetical protein
MYVVNVCLRLVPRCVSTGPVVVHLAENVNVNTKDSPTEYMTPSPGEADAARPPRVRAFERRCATVSIAKRFGIFAYVSSTSSDSRAVERTAAGSCPRYYLRAFCERSLGPRVVVPSRFTAMGLPVRGDRHSRPRSGGGAFPSKRLIHNLRLFSGNEYECCKHALHIHTRISSQPHAVWK